MAKVDGIKKRLINMNMKDELIKEIIANGDLRDIVERMEKLFEHETVYKILDSSACATSKKELISIQKIEADTLQKKIEEIPNLGDFHSDLNVCLNEDNTITAGWILKDNDNDEYACVCTSAVNKKLKVKDLTNDERTMPLTYCFCCAGHCRQHLERLLDIQLKTKEIISSPINSKGKKPCEFLFEII